jgi:hypothetical protein
MQTIPIPKFQDTLNLNITFETSFANRAASLWFPMAMASSNLIIVFSAKAFGMLSNHAHSKISRYSQPKYYL